MSAPFLLVSFNQERAARLLINYLNSQGIAAQYYVDKNDENNAEHGGIAARRLGLVIKIRVFQLAVFGNNCMIFLLQPVCYSPV